MPSDFPRSPSSFGPTQFGAAGAAEIQNSFADFAFVRPLPDPSDEPIKISTAYGPNFAYTNGTVPIFVAFGDSSARRFLFLPGETIESMIFKDLYVWAADVSGVGNEVLIKWGAQFFRPSLRMLPSNPVYELSDSFHTPEVGEYGATPSPELLPYIASRQKMEITPYPLNTLIGALGQYYFGVGHTPEEASANVALGIEEFGSTGISTTESTRPYGYGQMSPGFCRSYATLYGPGPLFFSHTLPPTTFANTPYSIHVRHFFQSV